MTHLTDAPQRPAIAPVRRPPADSPKFWLWLGAGSIALHAVLLLGVHWLNFRASLGTTTADVPIDLIELPSETLPPTSEFTTPDSGLSAPSTAVPQPQVEPAAPAAPAPGDITAPPEDTQASPSAPAPAEAAPPPTPVPAPAETVVPPTPAPTPAEAAPLPDPVPPVLPGSLPPFAQEPGDETEGSNSATEPEGESAPAPDVPSGGISVPPAPAVDPGESDAPGGSQNSEGELPGVEVPTEVEPAGFVANVSASPIPPDEATDIPDQIAQPIAPSQNFVNDAAFACPVTPDVLNYSGAAVELRVIINTDPGDRSAGYVDVNNIVVLQSSGSTAYDDLAACLLREWRFQQATTAGVSPDRSEVIVSVRIQPE